MSNNLKKTFNDLRNKWGNAFFRKHPQYDLPVIEEIEFLKAYKKDYEDPFIKEFAESQLRTYDEAQEYVIQEKPRLEKMESTADLLVDFANRPYVKYLKGLNNERVD